MKVGRRSHVPASENNAELRSVETIVYPFHLPAVVAMLTPFFFFPY